MKRSQRILGILLASGAFLAPQMLLPSQPALADKVGVCAAPGKDGVGSGISGAINTYYPGTLASGTSITVGAARGATAIQAGDLLLVIQMQGADIDATNTGTYGDGNSGNNGTTGLPANPANGYPNGNLNNANFTAGNFEYVVATSGVGTGGGTFSISTSLVNTYSNANYGSQGQRRFQVIRIPQYSSATLGGTVSALPWDGSTGGIVVMDVAGILNMGSGTINVTGQGFRGGGGRQLSGIGSTTGFANTDVRSLASANVNAAKGEGTAGTPRYLYNSTLLDTAVEGYPNGSSGRGGAGNAGGGGTDGRSSANDENAGGGGGSNGGIGGKGGNTWNSNLPYGGVGGAAFSVAAANRLVLGGGGGAGTTNNGTGTPTAGLASSGAAGGGAVLIRTGSIGTAGTITADGTSVTLTPDNDASGGGGAGGSVLVISQNNSAAGLTINARGGQGGSNTGGGSPHGPGGGGGGGVVFASPGISTQLTGGSAGTTAGGGFGGAIGGTGLTAPVNVTPADATTSIAGANCVPQLTVTKTTSTPAITAGGNATYTIAVTNAANKASATQVDISDALPTGFTYASLGSVNLSGGATRTTTTNPAVGATNPSFGQFTIPGGGQVQITFTVNVAAGTTPGTYQNPATATYLDPTRTTATGTTTATYNSASSTAEDVTVSAPTVTISGTVFSDADGSITINGSDAGTNAGSANLTVYAVDTTGKVINKATVAANGTYSLANIPTNSNVTLRLSNDSTVAVGATAPTTSSLPANWVNTGENKNGTTETVTPGDIAVTTATADIVNQNFGIEQLPNTTNLNPSAQTNPGGTTTVQVPTLAGTDPEDGALGSGKTFKIVTLPTNGTLTYNNVAVTAGQIISNYNPTLLKLDPNDGAITVNFTYAAIDAASKEDPTPATVTMPFTVPVAITVSGTVFSDADADITINGTDAGTNAGSANLTIYAVDGTGKVVDKASVGATGTYTFTNIPANASVTLRLSNDSSVAIGATAPTTASIPSGWYFTGQNKNGTVDGTIATIGNIALTTTTANVTNQNFGIRQPYAIAPDPAPNTCNPDYRTALNTGITAAGGQLAVGANDLNWTAEWLAGPASGPGTPYAPPRPVGVMPAVVVGNLAPGAWVNEPANARWISYPFRLPGNGNGVHNDADLDGTTGEGNSTFSGPGTSDDVRLKFTSFLTLPSNANTVAISLPVGVAIDNQFVSIKVNGVENLVPTPAANPVAVDYGSFKTVNITNGWQAGVNTIEVIVDSGPDRVGFLLGIQATSTQVCTTPVTVNGTVFSDADGSITINGSDAGTNAGSANLTVYAVDTTGKVVDKATVAANGTYSLANIPQNSNVTLRLSNDSTVAVGATAPTTSSLPANWVNTGENKNGTTETTTPGDIAVTTTTTNISNQNFGIEQLPDTTNVNATAQPNPGGTTAVQVPTLAGTDPEDGALGSGKTFKIVTLPTNGTLTYNSVAVTAGQIISNYNPTLLKLDPNDGAITVSFTYAAIDAAGKEDPTPATVSMPFTGAGGTPQILLVKRITANNGVAITTTVDDPGSTNDNAANWPTPVDATTGISTYLKGATNGGTIRPGDILEYTIYFLSNGGAAATNINLCDLVPSNSTFIPDSFSSSPDSGINLTIGATSTNLTNVPDADGGQFFNPGGTPSVSCSAANTNGAVVVNVVKSPANLPNATAPGTPSNSYGFIRFRARVN